MNRRRASARVHRPAAISVAFVALVLGGTFGASDASPTPARTFRRDVPTSREAIVDGVRGAAPRIKARGVTVRLPDPADLTSGVVGLATSARSSRAQLDIEVPSTAAAVYLDPTYRTPKLQYLPAPSYDLPRHPKRGCGYYTGVLDADLYAVRIRQPDPNRAGVIESVGSFPDTHVSMLAFGSIPVTATLHAQQLRRNGKLVPITADTVTSYFSLPAAPDGTACDPSYDLGPDTPPARTQSNGELAVTVSDVRVDREPLEVGADCHTVTPLRLNLWGSPDYRAFTGGRLTQQLDPSTVTDGDSTYPLHPGSANLTIPPFTGCRNPLTGEDVSKLITAMVSGPDNTLVVEQSTAILNGITTTRPSLCGLPGDGQGCVAYPAHDDPPRPGMSVRPK